MRHRGAPFARYMASTIVATDVRRRSLTVPHLDDGRARYHLTMAPVSASRPRGAEDTTMLKRLIGMVVAALLCGASAGALAQGHGGHGGGSGMTGGGWHGGSGNWHGGSGGNWSGGGGGNWHGGSNNWHGGSWHGGNWHGGNWHGGHWHNGHWYGNNWSFAVGFPYFWWGYPYYYPYYYDAYYYAPAYSYAPTYSYYPSPNAVYIDSPSGETEPYQPHAQPQSRPAQPRAQYYCPDTGYYPSVQTCPKGWLRVVPDAPPPQ
jgi:hypothetical protein